MTDAPSPRCSSGTNKLEMIYEALVQAQDCIRGETPEDISDAEAREDTINKVRDAMRAVEAMQSVGDAQPSSVTDDMVERSWAAIVGADVAPICFQASIIRADLRTALEAILGIAQPPTNRELHDAIAEAISNGRTYSGIQDAVRAIQKLYASSVPSTNSGGAATKHSGTFLGYRDEHGNEMHCAHAFCPHQAKCRKGCINPVAVTSTTRGTGA